jgi:DICT domain-containing protein
MEAAMNRSSAVALRHAPEPRRSAAIPDSPASLARLYLEMAERHRRRGDSPKLIAALVRAAWRLRFGT